MVDSIVHYVYEPKTKDASTWPFDADQYMILNIAIQASIDPSFSSSAMNIDYIRVYQDQPTTDVKKVSPIQDQLNKDFIAVLPFQGPKSNGMPELHKLTPTLTVLLKRGYKIALITDGRMSGASGKVPAAIHMSPEALDGSILSKITTGDQIIFDVTRKTANLVDLKALTREARHLKRANIGLGTELFANLRAGISTSETGASFLY